MSHQTELVLNKDGSLIWDHPHLHIGQKQILIPTQSTAHAVELIKEDSAAAIASPTALKNNNLRIYKENIGNIKDNYTIFGIVKGI